MSVIEPSSSSPSDVREYDLLRTSKVDLVSSMLLSLVLMIGLAVAMMGAIYFLHNYKWGPEKIVLEPERVAGRGDHAAGFARDLEPPGAEEVEEISEPSLEQTLEAVTETLSSVLASLDSLDTSALAASPGTGQGDSRPPGPLGEGDDIVPRYERWELKFLARSQQQYASQLDFYKIELGAIGGGVSTVDYVANFTGAAKKRSGAGDAEKRLYFMWRQEGPLLQYDRQLLQKGGVQTGRRMVLKFIPDPLQEDLAQREMLYAREKKGKNVKVKEIAKTVFDSRAKGSGGYEWVVIDQRYRAVAAGK